MGGFTLHLGVWGILALSVLALAVYRKVVSRAEDDQLHIADREAAIITQQKGVAERLDFIDRWGKISTVIVLIYGIVIAAYYVYQAWLENTRPLGQ
jgi:hypothetical protein